MLIDLTNFYKHLNTTFIPLLKNKDRYLILFGGAGSGKSVFIAQKILYRIMIEQNHRILVIRKVARTLRNSVFLLFKDLISEFSLSKHVKINKSDMTITFPYLKSEILCVGLDDPEKLKSITNITSVWIEEATELSEVDFNQIDLRLRGETKDYKQIAMSFNPISILHWIKKRYFDFEQKKTTIHKSTYKDNQFLDKEYKETLENLKNVDKTYYMIYALSQWGILGNTVFTNYVIEKIPDEIKDNFDIIYCGEDFGYIDPSVYIRLGIIENNMYILDEIYESKLTNDEMIENIKKIYKGETITADSQRPDLIKENKDKGLKTISAKKGKYSVKDGIDFIKRFNVHIDESCINTANEFMLYKWREDKNGNMLDEPVDQNNHAIDSIRYAIESLRIPKFKFKRIGADGISR